jgi:2,3-bisphosphoglycerate-independent phosphoglycerate mutase
MPFDYIPHLLRASAKRIVLLVMDGLGGLPIEPSGPTELEAAQTPNMDRLAAEGMLGLTVPIRPGISPGSGPAHLALFGYDPIQYEIGRGVLESAGVGLQVNRGDVAARGNFCTLDAAGNIIDRRAGRISSEAAAPLVDRLKTVKIPGFSTEVSLVKEYRFAVVMRGDGLQPDIDDTDPQRTGVPPLPAIARTPESKPTADLFNQWISQALDVLADDQKANGLTLRGFSTDPNLPSFQSSYGLNPACISVYPMYRGVAGLVGMKVVDFTGDQPEDEFAALARVWEEYDFFFIHMLDLKPDVLIITGDHSTPARLKSHSWHPVPFLLWAPATVRPDDQTKFGERFCAHGSLGTFPALDTIPLALAHAERLEKFGA